MDDLSPILTRVFMAERYLKLPRRIRRTRKNLIATPVLCYGRMTKIGRPEKLGILIPVLISFRVSWTEWRIKSPVQETSVASSLEPSMSRSLQSISHEIRKWIKRQ